MNRQLKKYRFFIWILPAAVAFMIFMFSAQPADESSELSNGVVLKIINFLSEINPSIEPDIFLEKLSTPVRKAAHITEYFLFYLTLLLAWSVMGVRKLKRIGCTMLMVFLYACSDEFHQTFVSGRAGRFTDVMIDCSGGILISIILIILVIYKKDQQKSTKVSVKKRRNSR